MRRAGTPAWRAGATLLLLFLAGRPDAAPAQPQAPRIEREVRLADGPWTDSGIDLAEGERLILKADGKFGFANGISGGPEGLADRVAENLASEDWPMPDGPFGAVIGRIGEASFLVGAGTERRVETGGRLELGANIPPAWSRQFPARFEIVVTVFPPPLDDIDDDAKGKEVVIDADRLGDNAAVPAEPPVPAAAPTQRAKPARPTPRVEAADADESGLPRLLFVGIVAVAAAAAAAALSIWRRARLRAHTRARLAVAHSLSLDPPRTSLPQELAAAWPTIGTRWRVEEGEPAFGAWAGEERRDG